MLQNKFVRFCLVGIVNTLVDVSIFLALRSAGLHVVVANIISTSVGLAVSLLLNYHFTFKATQSLTPFKIALYIGVTLIGLWALQPVIITAVLHVDQAWHITALVSDRLGHASLLANTFAKLCSIVVTLIWNYLWYSRVVFANKDAKLTEES